MLDTCNNVWNYVKNNIPYKADGQAEQKIILPARMVERAEQGIGADCKSFALFCAANISNLYPNADVNFRYTCYRSSKIPSHVYCVVKTSRGIIKVDPVWYYFNKEKEYKHKIDHSMRIATLSGVNDKVKVDAQTFETLKMLKKAIDSYPVGSPQYITFNRQFNVVAEAAGLDDPTGIGKLKLFKGIANAFKGAVKAVKKFEKKIEGGLKNTLDTITKRPEWASKTDYVKHLAKMSIPLFIEMRVAFLLALTINYRDLCNRLLKKNAEDPHSMERIWYKGFGGDPKAFMAALESNKNKRPFFGKPKGVKGYYDGITIGAADGETEGNTPPPAASVAGAAGTAASSIAIAAGLSGPQAAGVAAAITMAFTIIGTFLKNIKKHPSDDNTDGDTSGGGSGSGDGDGGGSGDGDGGGSGDGDGGGSGDGDGDGGGSGSGSGSGSGLNVKKLLTTKNLLIGGAALAALFIVPKLISKK
jgi:hypothetical protein